LIGPFRAPRFGGNQLCPQLIGKPRHDLVLHVKEVGQIVEQDRLIAERSGKPTSAVKSIRRSSGK